MDKKTYNLKITMDNGLIVETSKISAESKIDLSKIDFSKPFFIAENTNDETGIVVNRMHARTIVYKLEE